MTDIEEHAAPQPFGIMSSYAALATPQPADTILLTDVSDPSMAATGTTKKATFQVLTSGIPPSGDSSGVTDMANINAALTANGKAQLAPGAFTTTNILLDSDQVLSGSGSKTVLQTPAGTTGYMVALKTPASTIRTTVRDLQLIPNRAGLGGIIFDNTGYSVGSPVDPMHQADNVLVYNARGDAFHFDNVARELRITRCKAYNGEGFGFYLGGGCTDSHFTDCTAGVSGGHGWQIFGSSNILTACKAFWSGYSTVNSVWNGTSNGFNVSGVSSCQICNCQAQQAALHGFELYQTLNTNVLCCESDTNSAGGVSTGVGFDTNNNTNLALIGCTGGNYSITPGAQAYGIQVANTQTNTMFIGNTVTGTGGQFNYVSGGGYSILGSGAVDLRALNTSMKVFGLDVTVAGQGLAVAEGTNCKQGTATLNGTTAVVVANTAVTANSRIFLTNQTGTGTVGSPYVSGRVAGTSFSIKSTVAGDTSLVAYQIFEPG
jgi:hypothetical protein